MSRRPTAFVLATAVCVSLGMAAPAGAEENVPVGDAPADVAIDPIANRAWVANAGGDSVTAIDGATLAVETVNVGDEPVEIAVDAVRGRVWVANLGASVTAIDTSDLSTDPVPLPTLNPERIAIDPATGAAYVLDDSNVALATLVRIDPGDLSISNDLMDGVGAESLAVDWLNGLVWAPVGPAINVSDATTLATDGVSLPGGLDASFTGIALDPVTDEAFLSNAQAGGVVRILDLLFDQTLGAGNGVVVNDPVARRTYATDTGGSNVLVIADDLSTDSVSLGAVPGAVAANPNNGQLYVATPALDEMAVVTPAGAVVDGPVGDDPSSIAVNPVTNRIFVANRGSDDVTVLDGGVLAADSVEVGARPNAVAVDAIRDVVFVTNSASDDVTIIGPLGAETVAVGDQPVAVAVDPQSGDAWVANAGSDDVTRIDGVTHAASGNLPVGDRPTAIAINPVTGVIYVANTDDDILSVIDPVPAGHALSAFFVGDRPVALAIDPAANRIFVANEGDDTVTIVDGATLDTQSVEVGDAPAAIVVDPTTGRAYVANAGENTITAIDGETALAEGVTTDDGPGALALDPVLGRLYVANSLSDTVTVVDTASGATENVAVGLGPVALALDATTNRIFVVRGAGVSVIDGVTRVARTIDTSVGACAGLPLTTAVNPVTRAVYIPGCLGDAVARITESRAEIPLTVAISGLTGSITDTPTPTLDFDATSSFAPNAPPIAQIYYQVDSWMGPWIPATPAGAEASATLAALTPGEHVVYAFAVDGHEAASSASPGSVSLVGAIASQSVLVVPAPEPAAWALGAVAAAVLATRRRA